MKTIHVDLDVGQTLQIGLASVSLQEKSGRKARLKVEAPPSVSVVPPQKASGAAEAAKGVLRT